MACLEHKRACGHTWFSNEESGRCPRCRGSDIVTCFDEDRQPLRELDDVRGEVYGRMKG